MTTKRPFRQQIIISIGFDNITKFMSLFSKHIVNINRTLKNIKSKIMTDFICSNHQGLIITSNKVTSQSELSTIKNYIKNIDVINLENFISPYLSQSKSYLKIIGIPYIMKGTNISLYSSIIESIIWSMHIWNDMCLISKPHIIKVLPKSDMVIIWINIWDAQSGTKAKYLINKCFNISSYITTIQGVNINPSIPQCKNC